MVNEKMKVEVWSDVICPFCYISKRKLEHAISQFEHGAEIELIWKSFDLAPGFFAEPSKDFYTVLAEKNHMSREQAITISNQLAATAQQSGLVFDFEKMVPANSFKASRLSHYAKHVGLQNEIKEALFHAYFSMGRDIDDDDTLVGLCKDVGLDTTEAKNVLNSDRYAAEVEADIAEAKLKGVTAIPYYVFNSTAAVSGMRDSDVFLEILKKEHAGWHTETGHTGEQSCKIGEVCN